MVGTYLLPFLQGTCIISGMEMRGNGNTVIYDINVPSFFDSDGDGIGDIRGVAERLPYVVSLGVTDISLTMLFERSDLDKIYATTDFMKPDLRIGTTDDLETFIHMAKDAGLRVILPIPVRAVSYSHPWFENATSTVTKKEYNLFKDYFIWKKTKTKPTENGTKYLFHDAVGEWYLTTEDGFPLLNLDNPRVRREISDVIAFWRGKGVDAISLVGMNFSVRKAGKGVDEPVYKVSEEIFDIGRGSYKLLRDIREKDLLGEDGKLYLVNTQTDHYTIPYLLGDSALADIIEYSDVIAATACDVKEKFKLSVFLEKCLHSFSSKVVEKVCNVFEDSEHDRLLSHILDRSEYQASAAKALSLLFFTLPGVHRVYQGQEIGMLDRINGKKSEKDLPMQWDSRVNAGFSAARFPWRSVHPDYSRINVAAQENDPESPLSFFRKMIAFRNAYPILNSGEIKVVSTENKDVCAFLRTKGDAKLLVVCSFSEKEINYALTSELLYERSECILSNYSVVSRSLHKTIGLRPYEARVYALNLVKNDVKLLH